MPKVPHCAGPPVVEGGGGAAAVEAVAVGGKVSRRAPRAGTKSGSARSAGSATASSAAHACRTPACSIASTTWRRRLDKVPPVARTARERQVARPGLLQLDAVEQRAQEREVVTPEVARVFVQQLGLGAAWTAARAVWRHGHPARVSTSKPTMLRSARLNSTPIRWIGSPRPRYLSA